MPCASTASPRWARRSWRFSVLKNRERSVASASLSEAGFKQQACHRVVQGDDAAACLLGLLGLGFRQGEDVHLPAGQGGDRVCLVGLVVVDEEGDAGRLHPALPPVGVRAAHGDGALAAVRLPGVGGAKGEGAVGQQVLGG